MNGNNWNFVQVCLICVCGLVVLILACSLYFVFVSMFYETTGLVFGLLALVVAIVRLLQKR